MNLEPLTCHDAFSTSNEDILQIRVEPWSQKLDLGQAKSYRGFPEAALIRSNRGEPLLCLQRMGAQGFLISRV